MLHHCVCCTSLCAPCLSVYTSLCVLCLSVGMFSFLKCNFYISMLFALSIAMTSSFSADDVIIGIAWEKKVYNDWRNRTCHSLDYESSILPIDEVVKALEPSGRWFFLIKPCTYYAIYNMHSLKILSCWYIYEKKCICLQRKEFQAPDWLKWWSLVTIQYFKELSTPNAVCTLRPYTA